MTPEEEANLAEFLMKVQKACENDKSVPAFVGLQVDQWMQELNDKRGDKNGAGPKIIDINLDEEEETDDKGIKEAEEKPAQ